MGRLKAGKSKLKQMIEGEDWQTHLDEIAALGAPALGPLFSFLLYKPEIRHRAAKILGATVAKIAKDDSEKSRNVIRRFMWHMNEESGNIGWGIPEAFAETLVASDMLAREYARILLTYIIDLGHDDNYCDHDILRRSCYWAIGRLAQARPEMAENARPWLIKGLQDQDEICRGMAAWALEQLPPDFNDAPALRKLAKADANDPCEIFDGNKIIKKTVSHIAREALEKDLNQMAASRSRLSR